MGTWDLTALINAADAKAAQAERHLWLVRLMEWLRHAPAVLQGVVQADGDDTRTPLPVLRLRHLLNLLDKQAALQQQVQGLAQAFWAEIDAASLLAELGFGARRSLAGELLARIQLRLLPGTPDTRDLAALFRLLFEPADAAWIAALDAATLGRAMALLGPGPAALRGVLLEAVTRLVAAVHASGCSAALRLRMDPALLRDTPFRRAASAAAELRSAWEAFDADRAATAASALRSQLQACRAAAVSARPHLEEFGVSVDIVYDMDQLQARTWRVDALLACLQSVDPMTDGRLLMVRLLRAQAQERGIRSLLARNYRLLARLVTERSAETGEHYITSTPAAYRDMLAKAAGGGAVIAGTTFAKFGVAALGMTAFWTGWWSGVNYAASFVVVMLLHWTVATKQPAMTAPAMAASLPEPEPESADAPESEAALAGFVDRVAQLMRSQFAGIVGNVAVCAPMVLLVQLLWMRAFGAPLVGEQSAHHVLHSLTLLGPSALFAAFTGVLLFASSLVAGWAENWFVFHRLDSAIAWNPAIVARLGAARAQRWALWWRGNVSGLAANISLGLMLGLVPALAGFFGLPLEVRHVTLSSGQLGAALGALGPGLLRTPEFWWCVAGIAVTGVLNLSVSFGLAFAVALKSRGVRLQERRSIVRAIGQRLRDQPMTFLWPPKAA
jgi:site-specific recombinase